jgi:Uma2 family endonuclease
MLIVEGHPIHLTKHPDHLSDEEFFDFCQLNTELKIERDAAQNIIIMTPVAGDSGYYEKNLIFEIEYWTRTKSLGISFSSSTGFNLPNGATRSPDACWMSDERWATVEEEQKRRFIPVVPDFIVEVKSSSDSLKQLKEKMEEWIENGARLAWLIDTKNKQIYIYRENGSIDIREGFDQVVNGEEVMPGFEVDLRQMRLP